MNCVMMSSAHALLWSVFVVSCAAAPQETSDAGEDGSSQASPYQPPPAAAGIDCRVDPSTGVTLCKGISSCPGIEVDPHVLPDCGFRVNAANTLDLECSCSGYLCMVGVAATCAQAKALLETQDGFTVCLQVGYGTCTAAGGGASKPDAGGSCNQECYAMCVNDPLCIKSCGC